jgi:hypothetical protein
MQVLDVPSRPVVAIHMSIFPSYGGLHWCNDNKVCKHPADDQHHYHTLKLSGTLLPHVPLSPFWKPRFKQLVLGCMHALQRTYIQNHTPSYVTLDMDTMYMQVGRQSHRIWTGSNMDHLSDRRV